MSAHNEELHTHPAIFPRTKSYDMETGTFSIELPEPVQKLLGIKDIQANSEVAADVEYDNAIMKCRLLHTHIEHWKLCNA